MSRHQSAPWLLAFSTITVLTLLVGGNAVIEWAERRGAVNTQIPGEVVQTVDEPIFEEDGPWYRTSTYGQGSVVSSRFSRDKEQRWRMFVLGGSFAMGTPYVNGEEPQSGSEGGIASWLQGNLSARFPESIEIVNAAAGGQDSRRVLEIGRETLELQPDLLLIAMGNNEGNLGEDRVRANLSKVRRQHRASLLDGDVSCLTNDVVAKIFFDVARRQIVGGEFLHPQLGARNCREGSDVFPSNKDLNSLSSDSQLFRQIAFVELHQEHGQKGQNAG